MFGTARERVHSECIFRFGRTIPLNAMTTKLLFRNLLFVRIFVDLRFIAHISCTFWKNFIMWKTQVSLGHIIATLDDFCHTQTRVQTHARTHESHNFLKYMFLSLFQQTPKLRPFALHRDVIGWAGLIAPVLCNSCEPLRCYWRRTRTLHLCGWTLCLSCMREERGYRGTGCWLRQ